MHPLSSARGLEAWIYLPSLCHSSLTVRWGRGVVVCLPGHSRSGGPRWAAYSVHGVEIGMGVA